MREPPVSPDQITRVLHRIIAGVPERIEPATGGISTTVYRDETLYLRLLPDPRDSFASEVAVHVRLHALGVQVPDVVYYEHHNALLGCSVLVTTAIAGAPVSESGMLGKAALREIVEAAGRDLALIHSVAVNGFGRLRGRVDSVKLSAPLPTRRATLVGWDKALATLKEECTRAGTYQSLAHLWVPAKPLALAGRDGAHTRGPGGSGRRARPARRGRALVHE